MIRIATIEIMPPEMPLAQMAPLHEALRTIHDISLALCCRRTFRVPGGAYNDAGEFLDDLADLIGKVSDKLAERAEALKPADSDEFGERADILVRHEIACNGITAASDLAAKIFAADGGLSLTRLPSSDTLDLTLLRTRAVDAVDRLLDLIDQIDGEDSYDREAVNEDGEREEVWS